MGGIGIKLSGGGGGGSGGGIITVADAAARLALTPGNGMIVIQLDTDELFEYDTGAAAWFKIGGLGPIGSFVGYVDPHGEPLPVPGWTFLADNTNYEVVVNPTIPNTLTDYFMLIDRASFDDITTMAQYGSHLIDSNIGPTLATTVDNVFGVKSQLELGAFATITNNVYVFEDSSSTAAGAVLPVYNSVYIHPVFDHATMAQCRGVEVSPQIGTGAAHANTGSYNAFQANANYGAQANMATVTVFSAFENFQAGAVVDDYYFVTSNININSTAVNSLTGLGSGFQVGNAAATTVAFYQGVYLGVNVLAGSKITSYQGISLNPQFQVGSDLDNGQYIQLGGSIDSTAVANFTDININMNIGAGAATTLAGYTGININPNFAAGATITDYRGLNVRPNTAVGATIGNSFTGIDIGINSAIPVGAGGATGISVDMSNFTTTTQKYAASFQNGAFDANSPISSADPFFAMSMSANYMGGQFSIPNGSPVAGGEFVFGNNLAVSLLADDDMPADGTGLGLGFGVVGFVAQGSVTAGNTVEDFNMAIGGFGIPASSTGGTITNAVMYKALGALPQGGTLTITNMFGFRAGAGLSLAGATNVWGISIEDPGAENFFDKSLAIGTATKKVSNASVGLEIGGTTKAVKLPLLTTAQRNALTALESMIIYNTSTGKINWYNGTSWIEPSSATDLQGTRAAGTSISAGTTVTPTLDKDTTVFVAGNAGPVTVTATPPVETTGMTIGQMLKIIGTDDTNTVTYDATNNLVLNGSCTLAKDDVLTLMYAGTDGVNVAWVEVSRSN